MAIEYERVNWDTTKYVNPTNMNQMDAGIKAACDGVDENSSAITAINSTLTNHHETDLNDKSSDVNYHSCEIDYDDTMIRIYAHFSTSSAATRIVLGSLPVNPRTRSEYPLTCNVASGQYASATNASVWVDGNGRLVLYKTASAVDLYIAATIKRV